MNIDKCDFSAGNDMSIGKPNAINKLAFGDGWNTYRDHPGPTFGDAKHTTQRHDYCWNLGSWQRIYHIRSGDTGTFSPTNARFSDGRVFLALLR